MKTILTSMLLGCFAACLTQGATLITNGGFETNSITGWTIRSFSQLDPSASATTNIGWGNYALKLTRDTNTWGNPPGVSQTFTASGTDILHISFDYQLAPDNKLIFRIVAESGGSQYVYNGSEWSSATISQNTKTFQRDWGTDASNTSQTNNLAARTSLLTSSTSIVASHSLDLALYSTGSTTYRIEFFNPKAGTTVYVDNVSVTTTPIPESSTWSLLAGLTCVLLVLWKTCRSRH